MSTMAATKQGRRPRRQFDDDFRAQAVRLVLDEGKTAGAVYFWLSDDRGSLRMDEWAAYLDRGRSTDRLPHR